MAKKEKKVKEVKEKVQKPKKERVRITRKSKKLKDRPDTKEKIEIKMLPDKYKPMGAWGFWAWSIIYSFPVVGFFFMLINSFRNSNIARRNHARSQFCSWFLIILILGITALILYLTGVFDTLIGYLDDMLKIK